ncbi:hypothetical protein JIX56_28770 [Streptomyces sp. CA-210063]|uniref:hypothetical protein n=1 Tax=Streptomyces sp. CA-210063 TaxID=2801029 RepID=UPI00214B667A|nr:hypothetical protein [Streptomyces sp. CA-210063]UUU33523.1 hypothetical protein JIX56_28770 [Streptomyces sp. CA-210063]
MSENSSETVPVVLAEEQLLQLASAVATSLTAYFEAKEEQVTVVDAAPVEVTVTENVPEEQPAPDEQEEGAAAASPDAAGGHSTAEVEPQPVEETDPDGATDTETEPTGTEAV